MANGIRTGDPRGFNKGRSSKFREGSRVRQTPEEWFQVLLNVDKLPPEDTCGTLWK